MAKNDVKIPVIVDDKGTMKKTAKGAHSVDRRLKGAAQASSNTSKNFSKMAQGITGGLVPAYATLAASLFALDAVYRGLKDAADLRILVQGQEAFGAATGVAMGSVTASIQAATDAQISFKEASQAAAIGMAAGLSGEQMERLAKAATGAAKVLGRSVPDAFDRMTRGVIKAEPEVLDELGIILRLDTATENYAAKMGLAKDSLTTFEKSQAVLNEVLTQAEGKYGAIADQIDANPWQKLGTAIEKVKDDLMIFVTKIIEPVATFLTGNAPAAFAAMGIFVSSILKNLIPSWKASGEAFKNNQEMMQAEMAETEARARSLEAKMSGYTERGGMALGGAQKAAMGASPADGRTTLGKLQRGKVISARQAAAEITRIEKNKITKIDGMTKKQFNAYKRHLKLISAETKMTGKKMETGWKLTMTKMELAGQKLKMKWQVVMNGMQRVTMIASRAMSAAMAAMGWIGMLVMVVQMFQQWRDSTKEVDEEQEALNQKIADTNEKLKTLNLEQKKHIEALTKTQDAWRSTGDAVSWYANALNSVPLGELTETLMKQGDELDEEFVNRMVEFSKNMSNMVPGVKALNKEFSKDEGLDFLRGLGNISIATMEAKNAFDAITNSQEKLMKIQKKRTDAALKYEYKEEIDALWSRLEAEAKLEKIGKQVNGTYEKTKKELEDILKIEKELTDIKQEQALIAFEMKNTFGADAKDAQKLLKAQQSMLKVDQLRVQQRKIENQMKGADLNEADRARLAVTAAENQIQQIIATADAYIIAMTETLEFKITDAASKGMVSGLTKGIKDLITGKGNLKDLMKGLVSSVADAMAQALAQNIAENITGGFIKDPRTEFVQTAVDLIAVEQDKIDKANQTLLTSLEDFQNSNKAVGDFADKLAAASDDFLEGLRALLVEKGIIKGDDPTSGLSSVGGAVSSRLPSGIYPNVTSSEDKNSESNPVITEATDKEIKKYGSTFEAEFGKLTDGLGGLFGGMKESGHRSPLTYGVSALWGALTSGATGGYVTKGGIQSFSKGGKIPGTYTGKDSVPAMLAPGEYVLTPAQMASAGGTNTTVNVNMTEGGATTTTTGEAQALGIALSAAVNKEIAKQKRPGGTLWVGGPNGY